MGRQSLTGVVRTRTVDDDLADHNLTRQDISTGPYRFKRVWPRLRAQGWHAKNGPKLNYDHYYIKPGKDLTGEEGVDFFYGEAAVSLYAMSIGLFEEEDGEPSPRKATTLSVSEEGSRLSSVESAGDGHAAPSASQSEANGSASGQDGKTPRRTESNTTVKKEERSVKLRGRARKKQQQAAEVQRRQWPDDHRQKGRHSADAISLLDSDDDDDDEEELEEKAPVPAVKVEAVKKENEEVKRPASAKRKKLTVADDDDEGDGDNSIGHDNDVGDDDGSAMEVDEHVWEESEDSDSGSSSTRQKKRPKLTTRAAKKQKPTATGGAKAKKQYTPKTVKAGKIKSAPRGLMFDAHSSFKTHAQDESPPPALKKVSKRQDRKAKPVAAQPNPPAQAPPKPHAVQGLASQFEAEAVKPELEPTNPFSPPSPPARPVSRASSVASSHRSYAAPASASPSYTPHHVSRPVVRLDVDGVVFQSCLDEKYHVVITEEMDSGQTTIRMEEHTSKSEMQLTYYDITQYSEPPKSTFGRPQPAALVYQALSLMLKRVGETITVDNPPFGVTSEDDGKPFATLDLIRDDESNMIVLEFPNMSFLTQVHRLPMELVPESPRVQALSSELERTKRELEEARRDMEAFKKLHAQLERDYQKLRKTTEQQQRRQQNSTPPPQQPPPAATPRHPPSPATVPVPVPVVVPVPSPSPRGKDAITFHSQSSWLGTAHPNTAVVGRIATWALKWERVIEASANHFEVVANEAASTVVRIITRGSYQLNLNVIHETNRQLVVAITSKQGQSRQLKPSTVQVIETKNKTTHRSRVDRIIQCDVDDTIAVQLQTRKETDPLHGEVMVLKSLAAQANKWLMHFIDRQFLVPGETNAVAASQ